MTPSERERRIDAAMDALMADSGLPRFGGHRVTVERRQRLAFDAADEAVPVVSEAEMQRRSRIDHEAAEREHTRAERAEAAARDFAKALRDTAGYTAGYGIGARLAARAVLARHPSFSGEEGTQA